MSRDEAIELAMKEASMKAEIEAHERRLKWSRELILNHSKERARNRSESGQK